MSWITRVLIVISLSYSNDAAAQFRKIATIHHKSEIQYAAVDRPGELYVIYDASKIERYSTEGILQAEGNLPFTPDVFDPKDGSRLFAFSKQSNEYLFFAPSFSFSSSPKKPDSAFAIHPYFVCASGDQDIIILDSADWSLKKVNLRANRLLYETVVGENVSTLSSIRFMREYQNFIFILDKSKGIFIFSMLGKLLKSIEVPHIAYFNFLGEELYYLDGAALRLFDLFTAETRTITLPYQPDFALLTDERLFMVRGRTTEVFSIKP